MRSEEGRESVQYLLVDSVDQGNEFGWQRNMVGLFEVNELRTVIMNCIFLFYILSCVKVQSKASDLTYKDYTQEQMYNF